MALSKFTKRAELFVFCVIISVVVFFYNVDVSTLVNSSNSVVYVLYHDSKSKDIAEKVFKRYSWARFYELGKSIFFESQFFISLQRLEYEWFDKKYVGLMSYNIVQKQDVKEVQLSNIVGHAKGADVISFYRVSSVDLITQAKSCHPGFIEIWVKLLSKMGFDRSTAESTTIPVYQSNCWVAKPVWMKRYIEFALKAMVIMGVDPEIREMLYVDSAYKGQLSKKELIDISGTEYYTYHPFVMERLPCFFFWVNNASLYSTNVGQEEDENLSKTILCPPNYARPISTRNQSVLAV